MIKIFYGDDRVRAVKDIKKLLGEDYEVIEGETLLPSDLPSLFLGTSLFASERKILIRDLSSNLPCFEKLESYKSTPHSVVIFESKLDKRLKSVKTLESAGFEFREYKKLETANPREVFSVFDLASTGQGSRAVNLLKKLEDKEEPIQFSALLATQAIKNFANKKDARSRRILKKIAKLDLDLKSSPLDPWLLIESTLISLL